MKHAGAAPESPLEIELKLEVRDPGAARRLLAAGELDGLPAVGPLRTIEVEDRYLDTADRALERAGWAARLRIANGTTLVTVKSLAAPVIGAVHRREELEGPATADLEPRSWPPSDARSVILELAGDAALEERVALRQRRQVRRFADDATAIELSLDRVAVVHGGRTIGRFVELEAELRSGDERRLAQLGDRLAVEPHFGPARQSKLDRALAALERALPIRVLVLCTGNSCRSQMAEALLQRLGGGALEVRSAGTRPSVVNPLTIRTLAEVGLDISGARSKPLTEFLEQPFDVVVTVCDVAREACPVFPGGGRRVHVSFDDPALASGDEAAVLAEYRRVRDEIQAWAPGFARELLAREHVANEATLA